MFDPAYEWDSISIISLFKFYVYFADQGFLRRFTREITNMLQPAQPFIYACVVRPSGCLNSKRTPLGTCW